MTSDLAALEARLRRLEDERDVARLIASYGPYVDAADAEGTAALWATDGPETHDGSSEYVVWRATANHFELVRADGHWQISRRSSRLLNGGSAAHRLLTAGVAGEPAP